MASLTAQELSAKLKALPPGSKVVFNGQTISNVLSLNTPSGKIAQLQPGPALRTVTGPDEPVI